MMHGAAHDVRARSPAFDHWTKMSTMPNMPMRTSILLLLCSATLLACFPPPPDGGGGNTPVDADPGVDPCMRQGVAGGADGFPFDVAAFDSNILPPLQSGCESGAGCHGTGNRNRFTVYKDGDCPGVQTFNEVFVLSDYQQGAAASRMVQAIDGTLAAHPFKPPLTDALVTALTDYIETAKTTFEAGAGGGTPDAGPDELTAE
jgi:hypothetical protein